MRGCDRNLCRTTLVSGDLAQPLYEGRKKNVIETNAIKGQVRKFEIIASMTILGKPYGLLSVFIRRIVLCPSCKVQVVLKA